MVFVGQITYCKNLFKAFNKLMYWPSINSHSLPNEVQNRRQSWGLWEGLGGDEGKRGETEGRVRGIATSNYFFPSLCIAYTIITKCYNNKSTVMGAWDPKSQQCSLYNMFPFFFWPVLIQSNDKLIIRVT